MRPRPYSHCSHRILTQSVSDSVYKAYDDLTGLSDWDSVSRAEVSEVGYIMQHGGLYRTAEYREHKVVCTT